MVEMKYLFVLLFIGVASAQVEIPESIANFTSSIKDLPPSLDTNQTQVILDKSSAAFKEKCEKYGGPTAYETSRSAILEFRTCVESLVNTTTLAMEIEEAKPHGRVEEVFKKYCSRSPRFKGCFHNVTDTVRPCFSEPERNNLNIIYNVTDQLAEFVCAKDGDRIALFISENGPECIQSKKDDIQVCLNNTIGEKYKIDLNANTIESLPELKFGEKECHTMTELQHCLVKTLETCTEPTTANLVDSLFRFIRKATPCNKFMAKDKKGTPGAAGSLSVVFSTIILTTFMSILV